MAERRPQLPQQQQTGMDVAMSKPDRRDDVGEGSSYESGLDLLAGSFPFDDGNGDGGQGADKRSSKYSKRPQQQQRPWQQQPSQHQRQGNGSDSGSGRPYPAAAATSSSEAARATAAGSARATAVDPRSPPPAASFGWDDSLAFSVPMSSQPHLQPQPHVQSQPHLQPQPHYQPHLQPQQPHFQQQQPQPLDILGADGVEQLASGILDMEADIILSSGGEVPSSHSHGHNDNAGGGGIIGNIDFGGGDYGGGGMLGMGSRGVTVASSWDMGPGANRGSNPISSRSAVFKKKEGDVDIDNILAGSRRSRRNGDSGDSGNISTRALVMVDDRNDSEIDISSNGSKRKRGSNASSNSNSSSVGSVISIKSGGGDDQSGKGSKPKKEEKKKRTKNKRKNSDAIAKKAAQNLGITQLVPARPKAPANAYIKWAADNRQAVIEEYPENDRPGPTEMGRIMGERWREMPERKKQSLMSKAKKASERHEENMKAYNAEIERFRKTENGQRWMAEQERLRLDEGLSSAKDDLAGAIAKAEAQKAKAAAKAEMGRLRAERERAKEEKEKAKAEEEERKQKQIEEDAKIGIPPPPSKPMTTFQYFHESLRKASDNENIDTTVASSFYRKLSKEEKAPYLRMSDAARRAYKKELQKYNKDAEEKRKRAKDLADALDPEKRANLVDQMLAPVIEWRRMRGSKEDVEWLKEETQRLVKHQLDVRIKTAANNGVTPGEFGEKLRQVYVSGVFGSREQTEKKAAAAAAEPAVVQVASMEKTATAAAATTSSAESALMQERSSQSAQAKSEQPIVAPQQQLAASQSQQPGTVVPHAQGSAPTSTVALLAVSQQPHMQPQPRPVVHVQPPPSAAQMAWQHYYQQQLMQQQQQQLKERQLQHQQQQQQQQQQQRPPRAVAANPQMSERPEPANPIALLCDAASQRQRVTTPASKKEAAAVVDLTFSSPPNNE